MKSMKKRIMIIVGMVLVIIVVSSIVRYNLYIRAAKEQLATYDPMVKSVKTSYGTMSFIDEGTGEAILVAHGLFGGYDQGYSSMKDTIGNYRIIAPSRFGYVGTDFPKKSTMKDQAKAYSELLDDLGIKKVYILGTSAGGSVAMTFALEFPERVKGLILYCSGAPGAVKPNEEDVKEYLGVPPFLCNDFFLWMAGPVMEKAMNMSDEVWLSVFPVSQRRLGVINDGYEANADMSKNFDEYPLENIECPVLVLHSEDDTTAPYANIKETVPRFQNCTFIHFKDGAHMMKGHQKEVEKALGEFVK